MTDNQGRNGSYDLIHIVFIVFRCFQKNSPVSSDLQTISFHHRRLSTSLVRYKRSSGVHLWLPYVRRDQRFSSVNHRQRRYTVKHLTYEVVVLTCIFPLIVTVILKAFVSFYENINCTFMYTNLLLVIVFCISIIFVFLLLRFRHKPAYRLLTFKHFYFKLKTIIIYIR